MSERPELSCEMDSEAFRSFYYLKEELVDFCRKQGIPASGGKIEITQRIAHYLDTGEILVPKTVHHSASGVGSITLDTKIEENFVCSERHRAFFKGQIGNGFTFYVAFQKWLKYNAGKTYRDAVKAYYQILEEKKTGKSKIQKQFEYNTYIRDFFADNNGKSLDDAIKCWNYKKRLRGHNRYEKKDLVALEQTL